MALAVFLKGGEVEFGDPVVGWVLERLEDFVGRCVHFFWLLGFSEVVGGDGGRYREREEEEEEEGE